MAMVAAAIEKPPSNARAGVAYKALIVFSFLYYAHPEHLIPRTELHPMGQDLGRDRGGTYVVGAMFSGTEYELFPYFMVAYTSVLFRLATASAPVRESRQPLEPKWREKAYDAPKPELVWNR